ncbi:MAG: CYTH domain-containing protein, partial [Haemophilus parainfluenzae]|nr:CYTH domain-containing protein [Haemophilus parainfluenzae]
MSNEVELKLAVTSDAFDTLKTHLNQFNILEQNTVFLGNTYFDYPDHFLAKQKMGLRVRQENNDFTLTLKTDGKVVGGLHSRPEYNLSIPDNSVPTTEQLTSLYPFENLPFAALQPIFSTDFNRTFWLIAFGASKIEVAFDQGKI